MTDLQALLERVKKATGPDPDLDFHILYYVDFGPESEWGEWENLGGFWKRHRKTGERVRFTPAAYPEITGSIDAALALVERLLPGWIVFSCGNGDLDHKYFDIRRHSNWRFGIAPEGAVITMPEDTLKFPRGAAPTLPLAILAALLQALIAKQSAESSAA